ncbi:hypothetical protein [Sphingomonas asaccharolytica]|uniref:hypothetical protein n=1 Tax=Sphingomonas asaccharolytica TaxID=40681 RepID=UPI0008321973|nr:hypothetical protein [Sphingomonas asaccharolytica]
MAFLIAIALGWKWPGWAARLFGWIVPVLVAIAAVGAMIGLIYRQGETAGRTRTEARADKARAKTVAVARADERQAQATVDAIGKRVATEDDQTSILVRTKIREMHDALDATPGTVNGDPRSAVPVDAGSVRDHLNALIVDADRSADAADAER